MTWIETVGGRRFDYTNIRPEDIHLRDIAISLSNQCRFLGHTNRFYSVLEHSMWAQYFASLFNHGKDIEARALLHDAQEAYVADLPSPLKRWFRLHRDHSYDRIELAVSAAIQTKYFGSVFETQVPEVDLIDKRLLLTEKRDILVNDTDWEFGEQYTPFNLYVGGSTFGSREELVDQFLQRCEWLGIHD